uniref:Translin n=1 Tax=Anas platyrhynchos TaxID=8839 RepID=A0A8B9TBI0_ANAPL
EQRVLLKNCRKNHSFAAQRLTCSQPRTQFPRSLFRERGASPRPLPELQRGSTRCAQSTGSGQGPAGLLKALQDGQTDRETDRLDRQRGEEGEGGGGGGRGGAHLLAAGQAEPRDGAELPEVLAELRLAEAPREVPHVHHARLQRLLRAQPASAQAQAQPHQARPGQARPGPAAPHLTSPHPPDPTAPQSPLTSSSARFLRPLLALRGPPRACGSSERKEEAAPTPAPAAAILAASAQPPEVPPLPTPSRPGVAHAQPAGGAEAAGAMSVSAMFVALQGVLTADQDVREEIRKVVQALEQTAREILTLLQGVHQGGGFQHIPKKCQKAREHFGTVRTQMESLKTKFPADQYYRFHEHWRFVLQRLVFLAAFVVYLESETLVTREAVAEILGIEAERERGFHLDIEDYLSGVLTLASELARLAVNSVTAGDYSRPLRISTFINELDSGFRLLNLKNDSLRKRYDGLKYDVKKIEEVVYDLSIRGLNKEATGSVAGEK